MRKLFQFLKPYAPRVLLILCVLVVQAYCDLSLPTYTSNIVNVGIQQSGIDEEIPENISEEEMNRLLLFVSEDDRQDIQDAYEKSSESFDYDGEVLTLKDSVKSDNEKLDALTEEMKLPMMLTAGFENGSDTTKQMEGQLKEQMSQVPGIEKMSVFDIFGMMDDTQRAAIVDKITEQMDKMPDSILDQAAISYVKSTYEQIGLDTGHMSTVYILKTGAKMLGLAALGMAASILACLMASRVGAKVGRGLRRDTFLKVIGFSNAEFDKFSTASLITRSTNDIQQVQLVFAMIFRIVLYAPILGVGGVLKVLQTDVSMTWILGVAVVAILILVGFLFAVAMPKFKILQYRIDELNLVSREILTGLSVIRAFSREKHEEERFEEVNERLTKTNLFVNRCMTFMMPAMMLIMNGITVLIIYNGSHAVDNGTMQVGNMMAFMQYAMQIIMSFLMITMMSIMLPRASVSAKRINEIMETKVSIESPETAKIPENNKKGEVRFEHVGFAYPGAEEETLTDINFTAQKGETVAFIGSTGSGKSTLVNLIPRFFDVTSGKILVDGVDIREMGLHDLRERIGYVPQKGVLFSGTIDSNIRYGKEDATKEEVNRAAEIAQAQEFIGQKEKGMESEIAQGGTNVSGGQKQRLSIARAIAKNPEIYIFDDSFSALDYKTDVVLRRALKKETKDATTLIVAQRISTILHADKILVLDEGKIVGEGTHKELLKTCEVYQQIAMSQLSKEELEHE